MVILIKGLRLKIANLYVASLPLWTKGSALHAQPFSYFYPVCSKFKPFCSLNFTPKTKTLRRLRRVDKRTKNSYKSISFTTLSLPCFNFYRGLFYLNNVKFIPNNNYELLNFQGLAYLIMDDGSLQNKGLHLNTYAFSDRDIKILIVVLTNKFNLKCSIHYQNKNKPRIYIWQESMPLLTAKISNHKHTDMLYKIKSYI